MSRTEVDSEAGLWRTRLSLVGGVVAILATCLAIRYYWGPEAAEAQAPQAPAAGQAGTIASPGGAPPVAQRPNDTAAVVNGEPISRQELADESLRRYGEEVLESLLNKELILQACTAKGIQITARDVHEEIARVASRFSLSADRWIKMLDEERKITPAQYRTDIIWPTLALRRLAADRLEVTQDELNKAYQAELGEQRKVRVIACTTKAKADDARTKALANPAEFARLAKELSEDPSSASIGGLIPPVRMHVGDPIVTNTCFTLAEGEISQVVESGRQFFVIKCERHLPKTNVLPHQQKEVVDRLVEQIREQKLRTASAQIFQGLQESAKVQNVYNDPELRKKMPGIVALVNGKQITVRQLAEECLARHGIEVLDGEVNRKLLQQALRRRSLKVADAEINAEIARAAESYGAIKPDGTPDVEAWLKKITADELASKPTDAPAKSQAEKTASDLAREQAKSASIIDIYVRDVVWPSVALKKLVGDQVQVTEADMQQGYRTFYGERVEVLVCVFSDYKTATRVFEMARNNNTEKFFGELARQYSIEPISRANDGLVPPIRMGGGQPAIEREAFKLQAGELSTLVVSGDKYILMRCTGRTKPQFTLAEVRDELAKALRETKLREEMSKAFAQLQDAAQVDNFLASTVRSPKRPTGAARPVGTPGVPAQPASAVRPVGPTR